MRAPHWAQDKNHEMHQNCEKAETYGRIEETSEDANAHNGWNTGMVLLARHGGGPWWRRGSYDHYYGASEYFYD